MNVDFTIHISDAVLMAGFGVLWKLGMSQRDFNREVTRQLRGDAEIKEPGLIATVKGLSHDMYETGGSVSVVRHMVNNLQSAIDFRARKSPGS